MLTASLRRGRYVEVPALVTTCHSRGPRDRLREPDEPVALSHATGEAGLGAFCDALRSASSPSRSPNREASFLVDCPLMESPAVSMLWESVDPTEQLARRFGFRGGASVAEWVADALQGRWELDVTGCDRVVISDWNVMAWVVAGDRRLIAKWSALPQRFACLGDAARVVTWLDSRGIPVAAPVPATDGRLLVEFGNEAKGRLRSRLPLPGSRFLLGVLPVVEGDLLDVNDSAQVTDAGQMLAAVHEALASYPHQVGRRRPSGQKQLVHNDFRSANILYDGTRISAVLDLEEVRYDTRVADLAKAAVLLGTRYRDWGPASQGVRDAFVAAYTEHAQAALTKAEQQELERLIPAVLSKMGWA